MTTCAGACCAVFPMDRRRGLEGEEHDEAFIRQMRIPLTRQEAEERYARLGYGQLPEYGEGQYDHYTCRHWDETTRLCTVYDQRPDMCRDYPYVGRSCDRDCGYALDRAACDRIAERKDDTWRYDVEADGWRPRSATDFVWDEAAGLLRRREAAAQ